MSNNLARAIASVSLAAVCCTALYLSGGENGAGWFVLGLIIIWGS